MVANWDQKQTCRVCEVQVKYLEHHFAVTHPGQKPYKCKKCPKVFEDLYKTAMHEKLKHIECRLCKTFVGIRESEGFKHHFTV